MAEIKEKSLTQWDLIQRVSNVIKALMMGYEWNVANFYIIRYDMKSGCFYYKAKQNDETVWVSFADGLTVRWITKQASNMSEEEYFKLTTFIAMNNSKFNKPTEKED